MSTLKRIKQTEDGQNTKKTKLPKTDIRVYCPSIYAVPRLVWNLKLLQIRLISRLGMMNISQGCSACSKISMYQLMITWIHNSRIFSFFRFSVIKGRVKRPPCVIVKKVKSRI